VVAQDVKSVKALLKGLSSSDDATKKDSLLALETHAGRGGYAVEEMNKKGAIPQLLKIIQEDYGNPLHKELAVAVIASILDEKK